MGQDPRRTTSGRRSSKRRTSRSRSSSARWPSASPSSSPRRSIKRAARSPMRVPVGPADRRVRARLRADRRHAGELLLGDSVMQFSTVIGTYLFAMGVGSWLSRFIERGLVARSSRIELMVGAGRRLLGGAALPRVRLHAERSALLLYALVLVVGILVGLEIPLLMRILKEPLRVQGRWSRTCSRSTISARWSLAAVSAGARAAARPGPPRLLFGLVNAAVALWAPFLFARSSPRAGMPRGALRRRRARAAGGGLAAADRLTDAAEDSIYADEVIFARDTPLPAHRRHAVEATTCACSSTAPAVQLARRVPLPRGAGASRARRARRAARACWCSAAATAWRCARSCKYPDVERVTLVDLDPEMTRLFSTHPLLRALNADSLDSPKVQVVNADAFVWLEKSDGDASTSSSSISPTRPTTRSASSTRRRSTALLGAPSQRAAASPSSRPPRRCSRASRSGASSRRSKRRACRRIPYHAYVPSFGEWGFVLGAPAGLRSAAQLPAGLRFLHARHLAALFEFPARHGAGRRRANRLNNQVLVHYYEQRVARDRAMNPPRVRWPPRWSGSTAKADGPSQAASSTTASARPPAARRHASPPASETRRCRS